jgi:putative flippase GtrA
MQSGFRVKHEVTQFTLFVLVGLCSAVVTIAVRALLSSVLLFEFAVAISHLVGLTIAFTLGRIFVFTHFTGSHVSAYGRFFLINLVSLTIATIVSALFYRSVLPMLRWSIYPAYTAHIIGLGASTFPSYFGHRFYSFRVRL